MSGKKITFDTSQTYTYDSLQRKYSDFTVPVFKIFVGKSELSDQQYHLSELEINIPVTASTGLARNEASSCEITFSGMYDAQQCKQTSALSSALKIGERLEVCGGYGVPVVLFVGVISNMNYKYVRDGVSIYVTAMDSTWLLRGGPKSTSFENEDPNDAITDLLGKCTAKSYASLGLVDKINVEKLRLVQDKLDDGQLLQLLARRSGFVFAIIHGQVIFTDLYKKVRPILTLTYGSNLMSFNKETDVNKQVGKITVCAVGEDQAPLMATVNSTTIPATGAFTALGTIQSIKSKTSNFDDSLALTPDGLKDVAQAIFNERAMGFVKGAGTCVGLPELVPGRYLKIDGMDTHTNGTYFITRVIHQFGSDGFITKFNIGGAWSN